MLMYFNGCVCCTKKIKVPHIWNYFESGNGKEEHDRVVTCIKIALHMKEMNFTTTYLIQDVKCIVEWCYSIMG
jgi:hypothetical protein